jgi:hypothetical protein
MRTVAHALLLMMMEPRFSFVLPLVIARGAISSESWRKEYWSIGKRRVVPLPVENVVGLRLMTNAYLGKSFRKLERS